jgi:hypothetical protein
MTDNNRPNVTDDRNNSAESGRADKEEKERARKTEIAKAEYTEVVTQFRALTDIRFKLLAFLPLGTVAGAVFVQQTGALMKEPAIAAFAFVVTVCIATYNKRNDQFYDELVKRAAELERSLEVENGSFMDRPKEWLKYGFVTVGHRWPIGLIYAASASLWASLLSAALWVTYAPPATSALPGTAALPTAPPKWLPILSVIVVISCWLGLRQIAKQHKKNVERAIKRLMDELVGPDDLPEPLQDRFVKQITAKENKILDVREDEARRRLGYHWERYKPKGDPHAASMLLAAVTDLPARWLEDIKTGRS